jgi:hypothetical protein
MPVGMIRSCPSANYVALMEARVKARLQCASSGKHLCEDCACLLRDPGFLPRCSRSDDLTGSSCMLCLTINKQLVASHHSSIVTWVERATIRLTSRYKNRSVQTATAPGPGRASTTPNPRLQIARSDAFSQTEASTFGISKPSQATPTDENSPPHVTFVCFRTIWIPS